MLSVLKQEFSIHKKNILFTSIIIAAIYAISLICLCLNNVITSENMADFTAIWVAISFVVGSVGAFFITLGKGSGSMIDLLYKDTGLLMKTIPVRYSTQLIIKFMIPLILSFASLVVTLLVLFVTKIVTFQTFIFGLILITTLLVVFDIVSLKEELSIRNKKPRSTYLSSLYAYVLPILYFVVCAGFSYFGLSIYIAYAIGFLVFGVFAIPIIIYLFKNLNSLFMDLDVVN